MQIIHQLGILSVNKNINENAGFLLTNKKGSYCSFFSRQDSRYHGFFYFDAKNMEMYKFIENIEIIGHDDVSSLKNGFYFAERKKDDVIECFRMANGFNSLIYEVSGEQDVCILLDCKKSFDNREWGRYYEIFEEDGAIIVKFTKKTDKKEDSSEGKGEFTLFLAIKSGNLKYEKNDKWIERNYSADESRNSPPFKRHVYNALTLHGDKFVFSVSKNKNSAVKECGYVFNNLDEIKNKNKDDFFDLLKKDYVKKILTNEKISDDVKVAYVSAVNSLSSLIVHDKQNSGVMAGLPWFFQFWARDTLASLKVLSKIDKDFAEKILFSYSNSINDNGRTPNLAGQHGAKKLGSADAVGWLFLRCRDVVENINQNKRIINSIKDSINSARQNKNSASARIRDYLKKCILIINKKEGRHNKIIYEIESSLEKSINCLLKFHTKENFELNLPKETWMDTDYENDDRHGIRIEIQALRLQMYNLMFELSQNHKYKILENNLRMKLRHKFWNGNILADGLDDFTIRPNIFIASYAYPELLSKKEWETCFENILNNIWLDWGGLSTIDKNNKLFTGYNTGEDAKSYHRGDSWFWINNLAAIELNKINKKKFQKQIRKIISASTEDILWKGCIGCASEISSARELSSHGCFNQAWSNAMFVEMVEEIFKN